MIHLLQKYCVRYQWGWLVSEHAQYSMYTFYRAYIKYKCNVLLKSFFFFQPTIQKGWQIGSQECLSLADGLHNANFDWQWPVSHCCLYVRCQHATALHTGWFLSVSKSLHMLCWHVRSCLFDKTLQTGPVVHILLFLHKHSGQGIRLIINHHIVPRLRICGAWPSYVKGHVQLQFPLVSLRNRHMLTVLLTMQQRVAVWNFDFLWLSILILLYQHCLTGSNKSNYNLRYHLRVHFHHAPIIVQITPSSMKHHLSLSDAGGWQVVQYKILIW